MNDGWKAAYEAAASAAAELKKICDAKDRHIEVLETRCAELNRYWRKEVARLKAELAEAKDSISFLATLDDKPEPAVPQADFMEDEMEDDYYA